MSLQVYNTLTREKEEFIPHEKGKVSLYVCGITPYDYCHLGHARVYLTWDVIKRYFTYLGYQVYHVQNFTDIDDKIIKRANERGVKPTALAAQYIDEYFADMDALGVLRADVYPKVSEHIKEVIAMIRSLVAKGNAYEVDGDVYFSVDSFPDYGKLSGRNLEDMQAGARIEVDQRKKNPMDFALWKAAKPGEISWGSPWGKGRPGWHIECSVMSLKYLGENFDIHGGGADLIFPHHENEIAQSEAYTCQPLAHYWLHNGFVTVDDEKMSKSLGNFSTIKQVLEQYAPEVLRFFLLSVHYRSPIDFNGERLAEAVKGLERLTKVKERLAEFANRQGSTHTDEEFAALLKQRKAAFQAAMDDDFNTALAIGVLFELARDCNRYLNGDTGSISDTLGAAYSLLAELSGVLGLTLEGTVKQDAKGNDKLLNGLLDLIIELRQKARLEKDWTTADKIRDSLKELDVILEDTPKGAKWKLK